MAYYLSLNELDLMPGNSFRNSINQYLWSILVPLMHFVMVKIDLAFSVCFVICFRIVLSTLTKLRYITKPSVCSSDLSIMSRSNVGFIVRILWMILLIMINYNIYQFFI